MDLVDPRDPHDRDPDTVDDADISSGAVPPDPADRDYPAADIAADAIAGLPRWHTGFDGEVYATPEAVERREMDDLWERRGER